MTIAISCLLASFGATVCDLPPCTYSDTEVSTNVPIAVDFRSMSRLAFTLAVDASPSNSVEVAVGADADGNGNLAPEEAAHVFGYDCGTWFERMTKSSVERRIATVCAPNLERTFVLSRRKIDANWNTVKVTRRGCGTYGERATVSGLLPGLKLSIR